MTMLRVAVLLCFSVAVSAAATHTQAKGPTLPDTPAGKQFAAWVQAFNTRQADVLKTYITQNYDPAALAQDSAAQRANRQAVFANDTQGLDIHSLEKSSETEITVVAQTRLTERWMRLTLHVTPEPPHKVTGIDFGPAAPPAEFQPKRRPTDSEIAGRLNAFVKKLVAADAFSGAILVAKDGKPFYERAAGPASVAWNAPNRIDTKFNLGSMNKMFTSVAIAQLAEQGKLSYTDPIGKYLTDYPNKEVAQKVTIHHLLTHTAGIGDYFNEKFMDASRAKFRAIRDYFPLFVNEPLEFEPGKQFRYSNAGFMVLGAIVEKVSGQDYFDYVREHIYKPAGMTNTDAYELDRDTPNLATGYTRATMDMDGPPSSGPRRNNLFMHVIKGGPAGGGYSTVIDLLKFDTALRSHKLLSPKVTDLILAGKVKDGFGEESRYAYGFIDQRVNGTRIVGHSGGFPGINSNLDMYLDSGYTVAVMSNYDNGAMPIVEKLRLMLTQK